MPLMDFDKQETWDSLYGVNVKGKRHHFTREAKLRIFGHDHWHLKEILGLAPSDRILIVGAAFGWMAEDWIINGLNVTACDNSKWVHAHKSGEAVLDILDLDPLKPTDRAALGQFDICVTEDIMATLSDAEAVALAQACRMLAPRVAHWISMPERVSIQLNWKSLDEWETLLLPDIVVKRGARS